MARQGHALRNVAVKPIDRTATEIGRIVGRQVRKQPVSGVTPEMAARAAMSIEKFVRGTMLGGSPVRPEEVFHTSQTAKGSLRRTSQTTFNVHSKPPAASSATSLHSIINRSADQFIKKNTRKP